MRYLLMPLVSILGIIGWVTNIVTIATTFTTLGQIDGIMILRIIGVFVAPLGAVLGYIPPA